MADLPPALRRRHVPGRVPGRFARPKARHPKTGHPRTGERRPAPLARFDAFRPAPLAALAEATRGFAVMVGARLPVVDALETVARQTRERRLQAAFTDVARRVRRGESLADGFERHRAPLGPLYARLVRVGEAVGELDGVLLRLAEHLEKTHALRRRIRLALVYPTVVLAVAGLAVAFLLAVIVPTFADLFANFDAALPLPTRVLIAVSDGLLAYFPLLLLAAAGLVWGARWGLRTERGARWWDGVRLRLPLLGTLYTKALTARFCRTLSTLLGGGVTLVDALDAAASSAENRVVAEATRAMRSRVVRGGRLATGLSGPGLGGREAGRPLFPPMVTQMIAVGEETARLDEMLAHLAGHYEREVDEAVEALTSVIEPVLIVVLGVVVGAILVAIYLPMFDLVTVIE